MEVGYLGQRQQNNSYLLMASNVETQWRREVCWGHGSKGMENMEPGTAVSVTSGSRVVAYGMR